MSSIRKSRGNTFGQWIERMHELQKADDCFPYCESNVWLRDYHDNNSPEESWQEEKGYAAADADD